MRKFISGILIMGLIVEVISGQALPLKANAASNLVVDCNSVMRGVTHCASGSLYGVTETVPGDVGTLVKPLNPNVFTNPARAGSGYQQPTGAAIPTAERLVNTSGKVMIRLADICPKWPYKFPGMNSWLKKVEDVISDKKASNADNFYGYEIWNEPVYTWNNSNGDFNDLWLKTYQLIRKKDSHARIIGPSEGYYNHDRMYSFLKFCKQNQCVPDIICWHELSSNGNGSYIGDFANTVSDYRQIEKSLGIASLPISINEYCDINHSKEGCPGSSACYIAKFERYKIDSACISWWWTAAPGRLGSLLATNTQKGAGWWFYKWYGDMSGSMIKVTPPNENSSMIDGFACLDSTKQYISCLLGGDNDGSVSVTFKNLPSWIGSEATVKVEAVDWKNKDTVSSGPYTVSASGYPVSNGSITVKLTGCKNTSGYRICIEPGIDSWKTRYEAEEADISNANIFTSSNASNGKYVGQIDFNDGVTPVYSFVDFTVKVPNSGTYNLAIRYANGSGAVSTQGLAYNNGVWNMVSYPETEGWAHFATKTVQVNLNAGINIIRLAKGSPYFDGGSNYAELDYIEVNK